MDDGRAVPAAGVSPVEVYILFGSNLGDRRERIESGLRRMEESGVRFTARSSIYETEPVGLDDQPWFLNLVARGETTLPPRRLLAACQDAEAAEGRVSMARFGPRTLDVDVLLYGTRRIDEPDFTVPHPRMHERRFVLVPASGIAGGMVHPVLKRSVRSLLRRIRSRERVARLSAGAQRRFRALSAAAGAGGDR